MARYLLDSDAVIGYLNGRPQATALVSQMYSTRDELCVCDVVVSEVYSGLHPHHYTRAEPLFANCLFLETTWQVAQQAGEWRYRFARRGISLQVTDAMIAATALAHSATVVTANVRDYPMEEVNILPLPRG